MSDTNLRQLRVLHIVSSGGVASGLQQSLFMPLLTRMPKQRVKAQVVCLARGVVPSAVLRQNGVPVHDVALSRRGFSIRAFKELLRAAKSFHPDVIQAWGHTAQIVSVTVRRRCDWKPRLVWSVADTAPLARNAGFVDRRKLKLATKNSAKPDRIVYASEAGASQHRRAGFPDGGHLVVPPGVDATRFKPDFAARGKLRERLQLAPEAFVIGMVAPFQPEYDHATLLKAAGELLKANPRVSVVLAGHGVQKGNAPLMALVGGGALGTRTQLLGELSDVASLFNACDVVCSSALNDGSRMSLVMAMLCGVPCVATGMGAQGEVIGQYGAAIEPGSPAAFVKGITRVMQLTPDKRAHMVQGARKHALQNYVYVRSLQKYLQLYYELIGREALVTEDVPAPEIDASVPVPPPLPESDPAAQKPKRVAIADMADPDSLEAKVAEQPAEQLPKWRVEQQEQRAKREAELSQQVAASADVADVLQAFEAELAKPATSASPMSERARGVAEEMEDLLAPEALTASGSSINAESAAPAARTAPAPRPAPLETAAAPEPEAPQTLSLFPVEPATPKAESQPEEAAFQLELLEEPPQERKRAAR